MRVLLCWCLVTMRREENSIFRKVCLKKMLWIPLTSLVSVPKRGRLWILGCCGVSKTILESSWQVSKPRLFKTSIITWILAWMSTSPHWKRHFPSVQIPGYLLKPLGLFLGQLSFPYLHWPGPPCSCFHPQPAFQKSVGFALIGLGFWGGKQFFVCKWNERSFLKFLYYYLMCRCEIQNSTG